MKRKVIAEYEVDGYPCTIVRGTLGALLGYVDVPAGHPWHGLPTWGEGRDLTGVEVHGGVTYAAQHGDAWRVGFDCAHHDDHVPGLNATPHPWQTYRDEAYVRREIDSLVHQAQQAAVTSGRATHGVHGAESYAYVYPPGASPTFPDSFVVKVFYEGGRLRVRKSFANLDSAMAFAEREVA